MVTVSSFFQFLPESKLQSLQGTGLLFSSITPVSAFSGNTEEQGTLLHIAAHRKSVEGIIATSWIHVNLEEKEVLVSQVANIPNFHFFQNTVGLITSNIVSIEEVNIATSEEVKSLV